MSNSVQHTAEAAAPSDIEIPDIEIPSGSDDIVAFVVRTSMDLALDVHRDEDVTGRVARLEDTARHWADLGLGLDRLQQAVHEGFRLGYDSACALDTPADVEDAMRRARRQFDVLETLHVRLTRAYTRQLPAPTNNHHAATRNVAVALLRGELAGPLARHCGIAIAARYHVIAVGLPADRHELDTKSRGAAYRVDAALSHRCGRDALSLLGTDGGTLLIPHDLIEDGELGELIAELSRTTRCALVAAALTAAPADIAAAGRQAHELLETALSMRVEPGLYRIGDLGLHFQLTRPGPGRDVLHALLTPLDEHPELMQTLSLHLANDLNRQRTARQLRVHTNTIDYRLKRIHQITGCDPAVAADLWRLRSALIVRHFTDRSAPASHGRSAVGGQHARRRDPAARQ